MAAVPVLKFSPNGELLALSGADGTLKVWETRTGSLNQEYVPSSHLSATCTCLSWCTVAATSESDTPRKRKKRKPDGRRSVRDLQLVALGTTAGTLLLYSVTKGDIHTQLTDGHSGPVNDVCWADHDGQLLYSAGDDGRILEWSLGQPTPRRKWKGDSNPIHALCVLGTAKQLVTASREIKLWDLETKEILKQFTGHSSVVRWLLPVIAQRDGTELQYFLSATLEDRHVSVWQTSSSVKSKTALASLSLEEEPIYVHLSPSSVAGEPFLLLIITRGGKLQIFEHTLNGRLKKPVKPKYSVQIASETTSNGSRPQVIPFLSAFVCDDVEKHVLCGFGSALKPVFEKIPFRSLVADTVLVREDPRLVRLAAGDPVSKAKVTEISKDLTVLAPGHMAPMPPALSSEDGAERKTKRKQRDSVEMTMQERLSATGSDKKAGDLPRTDTLCTLLTQSLQSGDKNMLNQVLQTSDRTLMRNTVKGLPIPVIVPFVKELSRRMHGHAQIGIVTVNWIRAVLTTHTSYLMTFPELMDSLSTLYQIMENRTKTFGQLSRLQGKLNLMLSQLSTPDEDEYVSPKVQVDPVLDYEDESSDEQEMGLALESSEDEANWEEMSDEEVAHNGHAEEEEDEEEEEIDNEEEDEDG